MRTMLAALVLLAAAGQQPPRDAVVSTAIVRGRVVAAETGRPIRSAHVVLVEVPSLPAGDASSVPRATRSFGAETDESGAFEFTRVPGGRYRLAAMAGTFTPQFLPLPPGAPFDLRAGQVVEAQPIAFERGGVITGRVIDDAGMPLTDVRVSGLLVSPGTPSVQRRGQVTDDLGEFRLYGLPAGDYLLYADSGFFALPNISSQSIAARSGFLTTFYPSTPDEDRAQRVRVRAGIDTPGVEIRMVYGRMARLSGKVTDSHGAALPDAIGYLVRPAQRVPGSSGVSFRTDGQGRFQMASVAPGSYRITVRQRPQAADDASTASIEAANVPVTVGAADIDVVVVTQPAATIVGQIQIDPDSTAPALPAVLRAYVTLGDPDPGCESPSPPSVPIKDDLSFSLEDLSCAYLVRTSDVAGRALRSVMVNDHEDITNTPRRFVSGDRVTLVLSAHESAIDGRVLDGAGKPAQGSAVMTFTQERSGWIRSGTGVRMTTSDADGRFRITGLLAGSYFIVAGPRDRLVPSPGSGAEFFEELSKAARLVVVGDNERRSVDIETRSPGGGG